VDGTTNDLERQAAAVPSLPKMKSPNMMLGLDDAKSWGKHDRRSRYAITR
jgi:hypothetical protein